MNLEKQNYQNINNKQLTYQNNIKNLRLKFDLLFKKNTFNKVAAFGASATSTTFI